MGFSLGGLVHSIDSAFGSPIQSLEHGAHQVGKTLGHAPQGMKTAAELAALYFAPEIAGAGGFNGFADAGGWAGLFGGGGGGGAGFASMFGGTPASADTIAMMEANGMSPFEIMQATGGATPGFTPADQLGMGYFGQGAGPVNAVGQAGMGAGRGLYDAGTNAWNSLKSFYGASGPTGGAGGAMGLGRSRMLGTGQLLGGLYGINQMNQLRKQAQLPDPSQITSMPGYEAGMEAVRRSMASQGYSGSSNMMAAMQKYGGDFYNQYAQQRMGSAQAQGPMALGQIAGLSSALSGFTNLFGGP